jgi:hypothetical protein
LLPRGEIQKPHRAFGAQVFAFIRFSKQAWNAHKCKNPSASLRGFCARDWILYVLKINQLTELWDHFFRMLNNSVLLDYEWVLIFKNFPPVEK